MNKREFLLALRKQLPGLTMEEQNDRLAFYGEMIDDRMEEGLTEEEAVARIGTVEEIAEQILREIPMTKLVKEAVKPSRRLKAGEIVLLVLGSPLWISLLAAAFAVVLAVYISVWSVVISLWAVGASFCACALTGIIGAVFFAIRGHIVPAAAMIGIGLCLAGLTIFTFFGCKALTRGVILLTEKCVLALKKRLSGKENSI